MSNGWDSQRFSNISANTNAFRITGGRYQVVVSVTFGGGSVKLQTLAADDTTWISVGSTTDFTAAGAAVVSLSPGQYRFTIATATAVYASIAATYED